MFISQKPLNMFMEQKIFWPVKTFFYKAFLN